MKRVRLRTLGIGTLALVGLCLVALRVTRNAGGRPSPPPLQAHTFPAGAAADLLHVVDGDTAYFWLKGEQHGRWVKGRLAGVNTPECHKEQVKLRGKGPRRSARCVRDDEFHGLEAYRVLRALLRGRIALDCERKGDGTCRRGRHGRVLIKIRAGKRDVAQELVRAGVAWTYTKYPSTDRARLCRAELEARRARRGMWSAGPVAEVMAMMRPRTRKWYADHDRRCKHALSR